MYLPKTITELESWMRENCFNFNSYSINGNEIFEGFGIDLNDGLYSWYFTERGQQKNLQYFQSESEIAEYAFHQVKSDIWAKTHCIGFTDSIEETKELKNILHEMCLEYFQDQIPYFGPERPVYRTFVMGCDIHKTKHLAEKYYKEK